MNSREETLATSAIGQAAGARATWRALPRTGRQRIGGCLAWMVIATLVFVQPLARLAEYAAHSHLHSHILLVPFVTGYLLYVKPPLLARYRSSISGAALTGSIALSALAMRILAAESLSVNDDLALMALAYVCFVAAGGFLFLGVRWMAAAAFPVSFLLFMIPLPDAVTDWLEKASVLASADVAAALFDITGTPLLRDGVVFGLPGIVLQVAQECSGIRSSWVLFITSLVASHLFLESPWRRVALVAFVIPLGIVRNGFRILVIGLLCVHVGPHMIDSVIHHSGGPIFFVLSLGPLFLLLWWLRRNDHRVSR